ncbi:MAG: hypothetical protein QOE54_4050 [Streptosporangiaceae bacterium]|nr:hypothetical protein [Streptosporangiaceae bacterium]
MRAFSLYRRVVAGLSAGALVAVPLGVGSMASAATLTQTAVRMLTPPTAISYSDRQTTITGTLVTTSSSGSQGLGGEPVVLTLFAGDRRTVIADLGSVTSAADGTFSLTTTVPGPGYVQATFAGDETYAAAVNRTVVRAGSLLPSRVQLDPPPAMVDPNVDFTISGQVQEQTPDGSWVPANGAEVTLSPGNKGAIIGQDGRFSFTAQESAPANWTVSVVPITTSFAASARSPLEFVNVPPQQTRITSFTVHSNGVAQNGFTLTVHADVQANSQWKPYTGRLNLYFQPKGSAGWQAFATDASSDSVNGNGDQVFSPVIGPYLRIPAATRNNLDSLVSEAGSWRAQVEQVTAGPGRTGVTASTSDTVPSVTQPYGTSVLNKSIVSTGRSRYLHASLWEPCWNLGGSPGYCGMVPRQPVKLYFRYRSGKVWHYVTTTTTDGNGDLRVRLTGTHRYYRLVYPGSAIYAGTTSSQIYFSS